MARLAAFLVGSSLAVSLACGGDSTPRAGPTIEGTPSASGEPPALVVSDSDSSMAAALGTYCWSDSGVGNCVDAVGVITSRDALIALGELSISGALPGLEITDVRVDATPIAGSNSMLLGSGLIAWTQATQGIELPATITGGALTINITSLNPGQYVIAVFLRVAGRGDAAYGFLLDKDLFEF
jgi:hypothetical protein